MSLRNGSFFYQNNVLYPQQEVNYTRIFNFADATKDQNFQLVPNKDQNFQFIPSSIPTFFVRRNSTNFNRPANIPVKTISGKNKVVIEREPTQNVSVDRKHESHSHDHHDHGHDHHEDHHYEKHGHKKCGHKHKGKHGFGKKKYLVPALVGLLTAKAIILPLILKIITFLSAKGIFLGMVATIMASILGLKKILEPQYKGEKRDDVTKIEVVRVPIHDKVNYHSDYLEKTDESYNPYSAYY